MGRQSGFGRFPRMQAALLDEQMEAFGGPGRQETPGGLDGRFDSLGLFMMGQIGQSCGAEGLGILQTEREAEGGKRDGLVPSGSPPKAPLSETAELPPISRGGQGAAAACGDGVNDVHGALSAMLGGVQTSGDARDDWWVVCLDSGCAATMFPKHGQANVYGRVGMTPTTFTMPDGAECVLAERGKLDVLVQVSGGGTRKHAIEGVLGTVLYRGSEVRRLVPILLSANDVRSCAISNTECVCSKVELASGVWVDLCKDMGVFGFRCTLLPPPALLAKLSVGPEVRPGKNLSGLGTLSRRKLRRVHVGLGHPGPLRMWNTLKGVEGLTWEAVKTVCAECKSCKVCKAPSGFYDTLPEGVEPKEFNFRVHIDWLQVSHVHAVSCLTMCEEVSGVTWFEPTRSKEAGELFRAFMTGWVSRYCWPGVVRSDRGGEMNVIEVCGIHTSTLVHQETSAPVTPRSAVQSSITVKIIQRNQELNNR